MKYQVEVYESRLAKVRYVVKADSPEEALELAEKGETTFEVLIEFLGDVTNREVNAETLKEVGP